MFQMPLRGSDSQARWIHLEGALTLARPENARLADEAGKRRAPHGAEKQRSFAFMFRGTAAPAVPTP